MWPAHQPPAKPGPAKSDNEYTKKNKLTGNKAPNENKHATQNITTLCEACNGHWQGTPTLGAEGFGCPET